MATIANLLVEIETKTAGLKKGLKTASNEVGKFVKSAANKLKKLTLIISAAFTAATAIIIRSIKSTAKEIDVLAKTSAKLGIAVEALQELQYQAQLSGVSTETLNMALQRMVRRVSEAARGTGEAVDALKELGIDAESLARLSPDQQFRRISDAMRSIGNQGDKVRLAMKLFDSEGVSLVNTLNQNLNQTSEEFKALGITLTDTQAKAVEAFNDSQTKLNTVWSGFKRLLTAEVAPAFQAIVEYVLKTVKEMGGLKVLAAQVASSFITAAMAIVSAFQEIQKVVNGVKVAFNSLVLASMKVNKLAFSKKEIIAQEDALGRLVEKQKDLSENRGALAKLEKLKTTLMQKQATLQQKVQPNATGQLPGMGEGYGTITDLSTGRTLGVGNVIQKQNVQVQIIADKERLVDAVVSSEQFRNTVQSEAAAATRDAARATRR